MKRCPFCKGLIEAQRVEHIHRWEGHLFILRNVPAEVCTQCGEVFFAPDTLHAMDDIVTRKPKPEEHYSVPVFSL